MALLKVWIWLRGIWSGNPVRLWVIIFLLVNLSNVDGGTNPLSRLASLSAMSERQTFQIDPYVLEHEWTEDWCRTPDNRYFSNKAPGPVLLGFPLFWVIDKVITHGLKTEQERDARRYERRFVSLYLLSFFLQILPFSIMVLFLARLLQERGVSYLGIQFMAIGTLFGNTVSLFMNTFFGHAVMSFFLLLAAVAMMKRKWLLFGLGYGFSLLSDYSAVFVLPGFAYAIWRMENGAKGTLIRDTVPRIVLGGLFPAVLWIWYHWTCFGSPLTVPNKYQNPTMVNVTDGKNLWGIFRFYPKVTVVRELLIGCSRGLLWTQPWVLFFYVWIVIRFRSFRKDESSVKNLALVALLGLGGLFWMNSCFGAWHGGLTAGPRYLGPIFPLFAILVALYYDRLGWKMRLSLWVGLLVSVVLLIFAYSLFFLVKNEPLWSFYWKLLLKVPLWQMKRMLALSVFFIFGGTLMIWNVRKVHSLVLARRQ